MYVCMHSQWTKTPISKSGLYSYQLHGIGFKALPHVWVLALAVVASMPKRPKNEDYTPTTFGNAWAYFVKVNYWWFSYGVTCCCPVFIIVFKQFCPLHIVVATKRFHTCIFFESETSLFLSFQDDPSTCPLQGNITCCVYLAMHPHTCTL